jgi:hypothetical protein
MLKGLRRTRLEKDAITKQTGLSQQQLCHRRVVQGWVLHPICLDDHLDRYLNSRKKTPDQNALTNEGNCLKPPHPPRKPDDGHTQHTQHQPFRPSRESRRQALDQEPIGRQHGLSGEIGKECEKGKRKERRAPKREPTRDKLFFRHLYRVRLPLAVHQHWSACAKPACRCDGGP